MMKFREANIDDVTQMHIVRVSVKENVLSNPSFISINHYTEYITQRGKGWVCEIDGVIVGFAIADLVDENIWALFIHPDHEKKGIGRELHHMMMSWYFNTGKSTVWLSTAPDSRAEMFYRKAGWKPAGITKSGEIKFEMAAFDWK